MAVMVVASVMEGYPRLSHGGNGGGLHPLHYPLSKGSPYGPLLAPLNTPF